MGSGIVSNLLKMGHTVTVWNRTAEKVSVHGGASWVGWDGTWGLGVGVTEDRSLPAICAPRSVCHGVEAKLLVQAGEDVGKPA